MTQLPTSNQFGDMFIQAVGNPPPGVQPFKRIGANQYGPNFRVLSRGSLVQFSYLFHKPGHDAMPLVLITDVWVNDIRGINIHYLTFPYIKKLLQPNCNNPNFNYWTNVKPDTYISDAFRQYKRLGIRQLKMLDCAFLLNVLASVRSFDPNEVEKIRRSVREQINRAASPTAQAGEQPM